MSRRIDLLGKRFGRLEVIALVEPKVSPNGTRKTCWLCQCDCGERTVVRSQSLRRGETQSCGCLHRLVSTYKGRY